VTPTHYVFFQHALRLNMANMHLGIVHCLESTGAQGVAHAVARGCACEGASATAPIEPGFVTHHVNVNGAQPGFLSIMYPDVINFQDMASSKCCLMRTTWDCKSAKLVQEKVYSDSFIEFPACNKSGLFASLSASCLGRLSMNGQLLESWEGGTSAFLGEPVLNNQGHLMTIVHDSEKTSSTLAIFDADNLSHGPIAELWLPEHVPTTLHGCWA